MTRPSAVERHPWYGGCDGFGPLWMCSECTGLIGVCDGTFKDARTGETVEPDVAAGRIGDFLMERIEAAVVAGWGCSDTPQRLEGFMRRALWMDLPGNPWRNERRAAQAMSALEGQDPQGLGPQDASPVGNADAPEQSRPQQ